ncbi:MAG TPA: hydroxyacid dehydrogenase [Terriglobia bacterium]|nr:hydroxyacid dehydrogenase [Terriglobia bacterium]
MIRRTKPHVVVLSNRPLFDSIFTQNLQNRLSDSFLWTRLPSRRVTPATRHKLASVEALITTWDSPVFGEELVGWAPQLRIIAHCGGEVKARFARRLFDRLTITNAAAPMARPVAELAVAFLLYAARNLDSYRTSLKNSSNRIYRKLHLQGTPYESLLDQPVGMIGFGRIGRAVADLLHPFGTRLIVHDPYVTADVVRDYPVQLASLQEVLRTSHLLLLTAALTDETRGMLNGKALASLPRGAWVINVARGGLVDLPALTREVLLGHLRCALDVTDPFEPLPLRHPLRRCSGALITPHIGAAFVSVRNQIAEIVLADLERFFRGEPVENRVSTRMLDRMT